MSEEVDIDEVEPVEGPAFVGANCRIADGASIGPYSVLSQGVIVREGARVTRSVIDVGTYLGRNAVVEGAILGRGCDLRDHVRVHEGVAIGDQVTIGAEASIYPGVRVYPFKEIETGAQIHENIVWETRAAGSPFGRDGATGLVNVDLTPETAVRLAAALGTALRRGDRVVASRDSADACRMIQRAIIAGLTSTGVHVADLRISPAAVTRHVLKSQAMQAGIHVGRSSADPEVIQVRVFEWPGNQMTGPLQKEVEKHFGRQELRRATFAEVGETTYPARVRESYAQDILDVLDVASIRERKFRLAIDYGHSPGRVHAAARPRPARRRGDRRAEARTPTTSRPSSSRSTRAGSSRACGPTSVSSSIAQQSACCSSTSAARPCARTWRCSSSCGCSCSPAARVGSRCR